MGPRTIQLGKSCLIPFLLCSWAQSSQQLLGAEEVKRAESLEIIPRLLQCRLLDFSGIELRGENS